MGEKTTRMSFFRNERNEVVTEVSECEVIECDAAPEKSKYFTNSEDPVWITIRFLRTPTEDDLILLYNICLRYYLFTIDEDLDKKIEEDIEHPCSNWLIRFDGPFRNAWQACYDITSEGIDYVTGGEIFEVMIEDVAPSWWKDRKTASEGQA